MEVVSFTVCIYPLRCGTQNNAHFYYVLLLRLLFGFCEVYFVYHTAKHANPHFSENCFNDIY